MFQTTRRRALLIVFAIFVLLSLSFSIVLSNYSKLFNIPIHFLPERFGFFATPARIWEILLGSIGALIPRRSISRILSKFLSLFCISIVAVSAFLFDPWITYPGLNAVPIVLATFLTIMFGDQLNLISKFLHSRVLVWLGEISYNIYLVHWPILVIAQNQLGSQGHVRLSAIALSLPLANLLYKKVDQPIRKLSEISRFRTITTIGVLVALPALSVVAFRLIVPAVDLTSINAGVEKPYYSLGSNMCVDIEIQDMNRNSCISGDPNTKKKLMLVGDSHAASISEAVIFAFLKLNPDGSVFVWSKSGCPFLIDDNSNRSCDSNRDYILELIEREQPSEIMIANAITRYLGVKDPNYLPFGLKNRIEEVGQSHARTFSYLTRFGITVLFVHEIPRLDANIASRAVVLGSVQVDLRNTVEKSVEVKQKIGFIDLARSICPNNQCSRLVNGIDIYLAGDPEHLTGTGSLELERQFESAFKYWED